MNPMSFILVLTIFWIITIFISLPIGIKMPDKPRLGHERGAPSRHNIGVKMLITFLISLAATFVYWYIIVHFPDCFDFLKK